MLDKRNPKLESIAKPKELAVEDTKSKSDVVAKPHLETNELELIVPDSEDALDGISFVEEDWPGHLWEPNSKISSYRGSLVRQSTS
ncbi:hypothetical protein DD598_28590 [Enterobacter cloacae complex sp. 2DZ2F16B1]|nr:hypothetical protein DD598_28590 [Enterobacter cloacae complex sp. 2DZ2F16B1]